MSTLTILPYDPDIAVPTGKCYFRAEEHAIYINTSDVPSQGATLNIIHLVIYVKAFAQDDVAVAMIAAAEQNGSDGIIEEIIVDEGILSIPDAQQRALSTLGQKARIPVSINIDTYLSGWESGQTFQYINASKRIDDILTIQNVSRKFITAQRSLYSFSAANIQIMTQRDQKRMLIKAVTNPPSTPLTRIADSSE